MAKAPVKEPQTEPGAEPAPAKDESVNLEALARDMAEMKGRLDASEARVKELENPPSELMRAPQPPAEPVPSGRTFVAPAHLNEKILVKAGVVKMRVNPGASMDMAVQRDGDIWARFQDGILHTEDPDVIAWCEAHTEFCRDAKDPQTKPWALLIEAQTETASRDSRIPKSTDIGRLLSGDVSALASGSTIVDRALGR